MSTETKFTKQEKEILNNFNLLEEEEFLQMSLLNVIQVDNYLLQLYDAELEIREKQEDYETCHSLLKAKNKQLESLKEEDTYIEPNKLQGLSKTLLHSLIVGLQVQCKEVEECVEVVNVNQDDERGEEQMMIGVRFKQQHILACSRHHLKGDFYKELERGGFVDEKEGEQLGKMIYSKDDKFIYICRVFCPNPDCEVKVSRKDLLEMLFVIQSETMKAITEIE